VRLLLQMEIEARRRQEASLARELEEANVMIEEQYASMAEEVWCVLSSLLCFPRLTGLCCR
jgi:hypothetical protein